jgi:hypothetical protein
VMNTRKKAHGGRRAGFHPQGSSNCMCCQLSTTLQTPMLDFNMPLFLGTRNWTLDGMLTVWGTFCPRRIC